MVTFKDEELYYGLEGNQTVVYAVTQYCISICEFKGTSTSEVIGAHKRMIFDDYDGQ